MILGYKSFEMLLEAKIQFLNRFKNILNKMNHPLAKILLDLEDKELDINLNYFDAKDIKYLLFYQDDKVKEWTYQITDNNAILYLPKIEDEFGGSFNLSCSAGEEGIIEEVVDPHLIEKYYPKYKNIEIVIFRCQSGRRDFINSEYLKKTSPLASAQSGKVGRILQTLLQKAGYNPTAKEIEDLVNDYKRVVDDSSSDFELVSGEDIRKYYSHKQGTALKKGTLGGSCMRYDYCQEYLDIYVKNPNTVRCLILRSPNENDKILSRALVWKLVDGKYFMDRIYYTHDHEVGLFIEYATQNGWIYKEGQNSLPNGFRWNGELFNDELKVQLDEINFIYYPYLDTLKWMNWGKKTLSNKDNGTLPLESTEGEMGVGCDFCGGSGRVDCPECADIGGDKDCDFCDGSGRVDCPDC